jgi:hypothetical protein
VPLPPITDPYTHEEPAPGILLRIRRKIRLLVALVIATALGGAVALVVPMLVGKKPDHVITVRETPSIVTAIREVARLETAEVHVEKVVDLTDRQSQFFDLIQAKDALLLVAVGHATVGIDLSRVQDGDVTFDKETGIARITLPEPEIFSANLDEEKTYVYARSTDLFAMRNEHLEASARREAVRAIEKAAMTTDVAARARKQAERLLKTLLTPMGAKEVDVRWRATHR